MDLAIGNTKPCGDVDMITAIKDLFDGISRGFGLFLTERNEHVSRTVTPGLHR